MSDKQELFATARVAAGDGSCLHCGAPFPNHNFACPLRNSAVPTRDAAEGGDEITADMAAAGRKALAVVADRMEEAKLLATSSIDFWQRVGHEPANEIYRAMLAAAPPKPAPDAVRNALAAALKLKITDSIGNEVVEDSLYELRKAVRAFLSAPPVPPDAMREALLREERYLVEHFDADCDIMPSDIEGSFHRLRECLPVSNEAKLREQAARIADPWPDSGESESESKLVAIRRTIAEAIRALPLSIGSAPMPSPDGALTDERVANALGDAFAGLDDDQRTHNDYVLAGVQAVRKLLSPATGAADR